MNIVLGECYRGNNNYIYVAGVTKIGLTKIGREKVVAISETKIKKKKPVKDESYGYNNFYAWCIIIHIILLLMKIGKPNSAIIYLRHII